MDKQVSKWIIEFLIRQRVDDSLLDRLIARLPMEDADYRLKKGLLLRRIQTEVSKGILSEKILDLLELVRELDSDEGKVPSEAMWTAYCAVALDCTVRFLEVEDNGMYVKTSQRIWRGVEKMGSLENSSLISEKLLSLRNDLEAASSSVELRDKILSGNRRYEAIKAVKGYLAESWSEMGPSFIEKTAEDACKMGRDGQGVDALGEKQGFEGLENVNEAGKEDNVPEKEQGLEGLENLTEGGKGDNVFDKEQGLEDLENVIGLEDLENVIEAHNGISSSDKPSAETQLFDGLENVTEAGKGDNPIEKEQGLAGLENVIQARDEITPSDRPSAATQRRQGSSRRKHVSVHRRGSKAKISNSEEVDEDTSKNEYHCFPSPQLDKERAELKSRFADLNDVVRDPLPEALKIAEGGVSSDVQRDTGVGRNHGTGMNVCSTPTDKRNRLGANSIENIRGDGHPEREERGNENRSVMSDPLEFTEEMTPDRGNENQIVMSDPLMFTEEMTPGHLKRRMITPVYQNTKKERRKRREWSVLEAETLRKGVEEYGRGNWKDILKAYSDIFKERTAVDLKDKWKNLIKSEIKYGQGF